MNLFQKICFAFFGLFLFAQTSQAQCVNSKLTFGGKLVCENSVSTYVFVYDSAGSLSFNVSGGTIAGTLDKAVNARLNRVALRIKWDNTPGNSNSLGSIDITKTGSTCTDTESMKILIQDSTSGACN